jgi:triacylglycerol lipase
VVAVWLPAASVPAAAQSPYPSPGTPPPGANDFSCRPTAEHPFPVILVHGTFGDMTVSWNSLAPVLERDGYCVFALDYGDRGTGPIADSAQQLATFAERVRDATGAAKVDVVGHSQGGMMPRYFVKFLGGLSQVDDLVGLAPSSHGTTNQGAFFAGQFDCRACLEQQAGSDFLGRLNATPEAPGPVSYTVLADRDDEIVTPYESQALSGPGVTNVVLQDRCPGDRYEHVSIPYDPVAIQWVENALARPGPADPAFVPDCNGPGQPQSSQRPPSASASGGRGGLVRFVPGRLALTRAKQVALTLECLAPRASGCGGELQLQALKARSRPGGLLGAREFAMRGGRQATINVQVTQRGLRHLRRSRSPRVLAAAYLNDDRGRPATVSRRYTLKRSHAS